jgi:hypothetical protein
MEVKRGLVAAAFAHGRDQLLAHLAPQGLEVALEAAVGIVAASREATWPSVSFCNFVPSSFT